MAENFFQEVELTQQKSQDGVLFPAVLFPDPNIPSSEFSLFKDAIRAHKPWLESLLQQNGAVLFRDFPVISPSEFNDVVEAFGFPELLYVGGRANRTNIVGRVYTANESPLDQKVPFHHEMAYVRDFPSKIFFFCEVEPGSGGETPIVLSHIIYERMKERHPEFVAHLEEHGLIYTKTMSEEDDPSSITGRGWKLAFSTNDRRVAEERAAKQGSKLEWMKDGGVKVTMGPMPAIKLDKAKQRKIWFNSMAVSYNGCVKEQDFDSDKGVKFGDGKPLPGHVVYDCMKILEEECVAIPWQKGDVLLVDNLAVLHARRPLIKPPRSVLASLCK